MKTRAGQRLEALAIHRQSDASQGMGPSFVKLSAHRSAEINIPDLVHMPVSKNDTVIQNADGSFTFTLDYSALDGGDVLG